MNLKKYPLIFILPTLGFLIWPWCGNAASSGPSESVTLSDAQWTDAQTRFEKDIAALTTWFEMYEVHKKSLSTEIGDLQEKTSQLRNETRDQSNVFKEIRLKALLNDLKDKLEENSRLDHETDNKQKDLEEKCLSLIDLYNSRIEMELEVNEGNTLSPQLDSKINLISGLARKRNRIQVVLAQYRRKDDKERLASIGSLSSMKTDDKETLQLTLDLFKDRQKSLQDQMEKWSLEMDGLKNELKLQGEMKGFLKDIQDMNANANFPQGNLKQEDLEFLSGDSRNKKLLSRLNEVNQKILQGQKLLARIEELLNKVKGRLDVLNEDEKS